MKRSAVPHSLTYRNEKLGKVSTDDVALIVGALRVVDHLYYFPPPVARWSRPCAAKAVASAFSPQSTAQLSLSLARAALKPRLLLNTRQPRTRRVHASAHHAEALPRKDRCAHSSALSANYR